MFDFGTLRAIQIASILQFDHEEFESVILTDPQFPQPIILPDGRRRWLEADVIQYLRNRQRPLKDAPPDPDDA